MRQNIRDANYLPNTTVVSVLMNGNVGRFSLPDNELLRGKHIIGMCLRRQDANDKAVDVSGNVLVSQDGVRAMVIKLQVDSTDRIADTPLEFFYTTDERLYVPLDLKGFNPQKSYIELSVATDVSSGEVVELVFVYANAYDYN